MAAIAKVVVGVLGVLGLGGLVVGAASAKDKPKGNGKGSGKGKGSPGISTVCGGAQFLTPKVGDAVWRTLSASDVSPTPTVIRDSGRAEYALVPNALGHGNAAAFASQALSLGWSVLVPPSLIIPTSALPRVLAIVSTDDLFPSSGASAADGNLTVLATRADCPDGATPPQATEGDRITDGVSIAPLPAIAQAPAAGTVPPPPEPFPGKPPKRPPIDFSTVDPFKGVPPDVAAEVRAALKDPNASIVGLRQLAAELRPTHPALASLVDKRADALLTQRRTEAAARGGSLFTVRSGDIPFLVAKFYTGDQGRVGEILPLNPGMSFGTPLRGWTVGKAVLLPLDWQIESKGLPPLAGGGSGVSVTGAPDSPAVAAVLKPPTIPPDEGPFFGPPPPPPAPPPNVAGAPDSPAVAAVLAGTDQPIDPGNVSLGGPNAPAGPPAPLPDGPPLGGPFAGLGPGDIGQGNVGGPGTADLPGNVGNNAPGPDDGGGLVAGVVSAINQGLGGDAPTVPGDGGDAGISDSPNPNALDV